MKKILLLLFVFNAELFANNNKTALISIPKCGTHLLRKLIENISKKEGKYSSPYNYTYDWQDYFTIIHEPVHAKTTNFCRNNVKVIFIYRDPRDQIVSAAYHLKQGYGWGKNLSMSQFITSLINSSFGWWRKARWWDKVGFPSGQGSICDFYNIMLKWTEFDFVYPTTFEKLVGPSGGGDREVQLEEIKNIATFSGYLLNDEEIEHIADSLWGKDGATFGGATFRLGQIGSWKKEFSLEQKNLFKKIAGQLLIDLGYEKDLNW